MVNLLLPVTVATADRRRMCSAGLLLKFCCWHLCSRLRRCRCGALLLSAPCTRLPLEPRQLRLREREAPRRSTLASHGLIARRRLRYCQKSAIRFSSVQPNAPKRRDWPLGPSRAGGSSSSSSSRSTMAKWRRKACSLVACETWVCARLKSHLEALAGGVLLGAGGRGHLFFPLQLLPHLPPLCILICKPLLPVRAGSADACRRIAIAFPCRGTRSDANIRSSALVELASGIVKQQHMMSASAACKGTSFGSPAFTSFLNAACPQGRSSFWARTRAARRGHGAPSRPAAARAPPSLAETSFWPPPHLPCSCPGGTSAPGFCTPAHA